jgi:hypothetical protein
LGDACGAEGDRPAEASRGSARWSSVRSPESGVERVLSATLHSDHRKVFLDAFGLVAQHVQLGDGRNSASKHWSRDPEIQQAPQGRQSRSGGSATRLSCLRRQNTENQCTADVTKSTCFIPHYPKSGRLARLFLEGKLHFLQLDCHRLSKPHRTVHISPDPFRQKVRAPARP